jgi:hypothetical protein
VRGSGETANGIGVRTSKELAPQQPGARTPVAPVITPVTTVIAAVLAPVTPVVATVAATLATAE